jgi:hypothetical protein
MAAFFAIAIESFPVNDNGRLPMSYVLKYMRKRTCHPSPIRILASAHANYFFNSHHFGCYLNSFHPGSLQSRPHCQVATSTGKGSYLVGLHNYYYGDTSPCHLDESFSVRPKGCLDCDHRFVGSIGWDWTRHICISLGRSPHVRVGFIYR